MLLQSGAHTTVIVEPNILNLNVDSWEHGRFIVGNKCHAKHGKRR